MVGRHDAVTDGQTLDLRFDRFASLGVKTGQSASQTQGLYSETLNGNISSCGP
jgi:hypothetical protein